MEETHEHDHHQYEIHKISAPGLQLAIILLGVFMAVLDSSVVNVAIPKLEMDLNANTDQIQWVLTGYLLVSGVVIPISGWLTDRFGAKRLFIFSLITFTIGSALVGMSWNLNAMIFFRILQAAGGGFMMPVSTAMIYRIFPPERRGAIMGIFGLTLLTAPALGPVLGGYFVQYVNWRLIFYINVPIGIVASLLSIFVLYDFPHEAKEKLDILGFLFSTGGFFSILYGINNISEYGWGSLLVYPFLALGVALLIMLVATELLSDHPMIELRVFKDYLFTMSVLITSVVQVALFVAIFLLPLYLQNLMGYTALQTGLFMTPGALISALIMFASGQLLNRVGARKLALIGFSIVIVATYGFSLLSLNSTYGTLQFLYIIRSVGISMTMMPILTVGLNQMPVKWLSQASAVSNTVRQVAGSFGVAVLTAYMSTQDKLHVFRLSAKVAVNTPQVLQLTQLQGALHALGIPAYLDHTVALMKVYGWIQEQGFVLGLDDTFMISTLLTVLALVLTMFFDSKHERELRARRAREGAKMAVAVVE